MNKIRHEAYRNVLRALEEESDLRPKEKELLRDSAEGLLLDDDHPDELLQRATQQLSRLVTSDRWMPDSAEDFLDLLESCASSESADEHA